MQRVGATEVPGTAKVNCGRNFHKHRVTMGSFDDHVVVGNVEKVEACEDLRCPCMLNKSDGVTQTLRDLFKNKMFPWETREMVPHNVDTTYQLTKKKKKQSKKIAPSLTKRQSPARSPPKTKR